MGRLRAVLGAAAALAASTPGCFYFLELSGSGYGVAGGNESLRTAGGLGAAGGVSFDWRHARFGAGVGGDGVITSAGGRSGVLTVQGLYLRGDVTLARPSERIAVRLTALAEGGMSTLFQGGDAALPAQTLTGAGLSGFVGATLTLFPPDDATSSLHLSLGVAGVYASPSGVDPIGAIGPQLRLTFSNDLTENRF